MKELFEREKGGGIQSHQDLFIILDALPLPISWATLPDGKIQFTNRAFKKIFGYEDNQFTEVIDWVESTYINESERRLAINHWKKLWTPQSTGVSEVAPFEIQVKTAYGTVLFVQHRGIILHDINIGIAIFEDITARKLAESYLQRIAYEDALTGLANRHALQMHWDAMHAGKVAEVPKRQALLLFDLDGFKQVNDRYGHDVGDGLLIIVAEEIKRCCRQQDFVCRLGGDEFLILLSDFSDTAVVEKICRDIEAAFTTPFIVGEHSLSLGASIGISLYPEQATSLRELFKKADQALYRLKRSRKGGWAWFAPPK